MSETVKSDKLVVSASPHITRKRTTRGIMLDVIIALVPAIAAAVIFFGMVSLVMVVICAAVCVTSELLFTVIRKGGVPFASGWWEKTKKNAKESSIFDCSAVVTGILLALNLPVILSKGADGKQIPLGSVFDFNIDWGSTFLLCIIGSVFAIVLVKMLFGGIGKNFANPAMTARIFLLITFAKIMTAPALNLIGDATTSATWLTQSHQVEAAVASPSFLDMFLGVKNSAAVGEVSILALLIGGVYLCVRKVIDFRLPLLIIVTATLFAFLTSFIKYVQVTEIVNGEEVVKTVWKGGFGLDTSVILPSMMSGGLFLGAIFMATDYSSSPDTKWGNIIYALGIGLLVGIFRKFSQYPEGVSFAIVLMNIMTPLIDKYIVPRPFGKKKEEKPLKNPKTAKEAA